MNTAEINELLAHLSPEERAEIEELVVQDLEAHAWRPLPGPQTIAHDSLADIIGYGGAAGGGKTDLACGKALTQHERVMILRREATQLTGIIDRLIELVGHRNGYNGQDKIFRLPGQQIEFGSVPNAGDETKYQGRPHDLLVFDEAVNFLEQQVRFLLGWLRTTTPGQRCQALLTFNPPTTVEGRWIIQFFAPWLDAKFPRPAMPGELRWAAQIPQSNGTSVDLWVQDNRPFVLVDGAPAYDFDPKQYKPTEIIRPMSRTFIPSRIGDNPFLVNTGYMATLQALPEPLRSQMLNGDFKAGVTDDVWQVIPTAWVERAQARWQDRSPKGEMMALGVDVARGGKDQTILASKHVGMWFDRLQCHPGKETPDGQAVVGHMVGAVRDGAPILIDVIGVGASPYDLAKKSMEIHGINVSEKSMATDRSGRLTFFNLRSELIWKFRELLDPMYDSGIALPPDRELLADLCSFTWELRGMTIKVDSREEVFARIKRSPDRASAVFLAAIDMPKLATMANQVGRETVINYDPLAHLPNQQGNSSNYDPMSYR